MPTPLQLLEMSNRLVSLGTSNFGKLLFLLIPESFSLSERKVQEGVYLFQSEMHPSQKLRPVFLESSKTE